MTTATTATATATATTTMARGHKMCFANIHHVDLMSKKDEDASKRFPFSNEFLVYNRIR